MGRWTNDKVEQFKVLFAQTDPILSYADIGIALGEGFTRSVCISKARRIGLLREENAIAKPRKKGDPKASPAKSSRKDPDRIRDLAPDTSPYAVSLLDATEGQCRWPLGEPTANMMFCGDVKVHGHPYCDRHCQVSYYTAHHLSEQDR